MPDIAVAGPSPAPQTSQQTAEEKAAAEERAKREAELAAQKAAEDAYDIYFRHPSVSLQKQMSVTSQLTVRSMLGQPPLIFPASCSAEQAMVMLRPMTLETRNNNIRSASANLKAQSDRKERAQQDEMARVKDWMKAFAESVKNNKASSALKWITRILVPALAVLAVPLTLGAAAPVVALVAITSAYSLAQFASEEAGGPSLSVAEHLTNGIAKGLQEAGLSEQDAKHYAMAIAGAIVVVAAVALRQSGGVSGLAGAASSARTAAQVASVAAKAATPLMVALDPKFIGNLAGGLTYSLMQADNAVKGKELTAEEKEKQTQVASIVNTVFSVASQLLVGFSIMRQASKLKQVADLGEKGMELSANAAKLLKTGQVMNDAMTLSNGGNSVARAGLDMETAQLEFLAAIAESDMDRAELTVDNIDPQEFMAFLKLMLQANQKFEGAAAEADRRNEHGKQVTRRDYS